MSRSIKIILAAAFTLILTVACVGSLLPSSSPDAVSTIVAATMQAISTQATQTPIPSASPTAVVVPTLTPVSPPTSPASGSNGSPLSVTRINFLTGATTGVVSAPIQDGQVQYYVASAQQGQPMFVSVDSLNQDVTLSIKTQGGTSLLSASLHQTTWQGTLPQTEDYYLTI